MLFLELGSVPHKYYLINFKLPEFITDSAGKAKRVNYQIGRFEEVHMPGDIKILVEIFFGFMKIVINSKKSRKIIELF